MARDYGELLIQLGDLERAEELLRDAFKEARDANIAEVGADLLRLHGSVAVLTGDLARGRSEIEATLAFAEKHSVLLVAAKACGDLADIEERDSRANEASEALRRGLDSIELSWDGARWWVAAITTDFEGPGKTIPDWIG